MARRARRPRRPRAQRLWRRWHGRGRARPAAPARQELRAARRPRPAAIAGCLLAAVLALVLARVVPAGFGEQAATPPDLALPFRADRAPPRPEAPPAALQASPALHLPASLFIEAMRAPAAEPAASVTQGGGGEPAWLRFAMAASPGDGPMIAIVLDDFGLDRVNAARALALPAPLTLSVMTYARGAQGWADAARRAGHEVMLHMPMEALGAGEDPGPQALLTGLDPAALAARMRWGFERFQGYVGINNHMGSRFTASERGMLPLMREVKARGLLFLDSMTTPRSVGGRLAHQLGVPFVRRDVFLDNVPSVAAIDEQLARLEALARRRGYAVGIGHPRPATIAALAAWLPQARAHGLRLVPLTAVARRENAPLLLAQSAAGAPR